MDRRLSNRDSQKLLDTAKKSITDAIKTPLKRTIQKTAEATADLIGNKIAEEITGVSKKSTKELPNDKTDAKRATTNKRYVSPEERQQIIDEFSLL